MGYGIRGAASGQAMDRHIGQVEVESFGSEYVNLTPCFRLTRLGFNLLLISEYVLDSQQTTSCLTTLGIINWVNGSVRGQQQTMTVQLFFSDPSASVLIYFRALQLHSSQLPHQHPNLRPKLRS